MSQMSGLKSITRAVMQNYSSERVRCPSPGCVGRRSPSIHNIYGAQLSQEERQHVGRGVAGLNIWWNVVGVRKDECLQRLVGLCIPEGFAQLLKYKWTFQSVFDELKTDSVKSVGSTTHQLLHYLYTDAMAHMVLCLQEKMLRERPEEDSMAYLGRCLSIPLAHYVSFSSLWDFSL